jgi:Ca2+-binding RTX toxin-like protein
MKTLISIGVVCAGVAMWSAPAGAVITLTNPSAWGNDAVDIVVAKRSIAGIDNIVVYWRRVSNNACASTVIGIALNNDYVLQSAGGADYIQILQNVAFPVNFCGMNDLYNPADLMGTGHYFDIVGGAGNDIITVGNTNTWLSGGSGNDTLSSLNPDAHVWGDDGDDSLGTISTGSGEYLYGGDGNDCLTDWWNGAVTIDCGSGYDVYSGSSSSIVGCEAQGSGC